MASVATGIDFESGGATTSTGGAMRARCSDQSGGTDSGDAAEAWASYGQELRVRDGATFGDALADLGAGRLVHLDVWQAAFILLAILMWALWASWAVRRSAVGGVRVHVAP